MNKAGERMLSDLTGLCPVRFELFILLILDELLLLSTNRMVSGYDSSRGD